MNLLNNPIIADPKRRFTITGLGAIAASLVIFTAVVATKPEVVPVNQVKGAQIEEWTADNSSGAANSGSDSSDQSGSDSDSSSSDQPSPNSSSNSNQVSGLTSPNIVASNFINNTSNTVATNNTTPSKEEVTWVSEKSSKDKDDKKTTTDKKDTKDTKDKVNTTESVNLEELVKQLASLSENEKSPIELSDSTLSLSGGKEGIYGVSEVDDITVHRLRSAKSQTATVSQLWKMVVENVSTTFYDVEKSEILQIKAYLEDKEIEFDESWLTLPETISLDEATKEISGSTFSPVRDTEGEGSFKLDIDQPLDRLDISLATSPSGGRNVFYDPITYDKQVTKTVKDEENTNTATSETTENDDTTLNNVDTTTNSEVDQENQEVDEENQELNEVIQEVIQEEEVTQAIVNA